MPEPIGRTDAGELAAHAPAALAQAQSAARAAGVEVRDLATVTEFGAAVELFGAIWGRTDFPPVSVELLRALGKAGNYVAGAFSGGRLVGAAAGFFEPPATRALHSHIGAVLPELAGRGAGRALKLHQRGWALAHGVATVAWTFDPLIRRNAYFNLVKLAARPVEYLPDFYGTMQDQINAGDRTDRLLLHWELLAPEVVATARGDFAQVSAADARHRGAEVVLGVTPDGGPLVSTSSTGRESTAGGGSAAGGPPSTGGDGARAVLIAVPADIETLRLSDPPLAAAWRTALREALEPVLAAGGRFTGFDPSGWYLVEFPETARPERRPGQEPAEQRRSSRPHWRRSPR